MTYEEKQQIRAERKRTASYRYQYGLFHKKYLFWMRLPTTDDARRFVTCLLWVWSKCGVPKPILRCVLGVVGAADYVYVSISLKFAKMYFAMKMVYRALKLCWYHEPQYDYDDLTAAVLEGNIDLLRLIFLDKHSALSADESSLDGKTMLFMAMERLLQHEHQLREEMDALARKDRVSAGLFFANESQQRGELEDVEREDEKARRNEERAQIKKEKAELRQSRRNTRKGLDVRSSHLDKMIKEQHKKKSKAERMKEEAMRPPTPLDLMKKAEKLEKTCDFLVKRGSSINVQQDPRRHEGSGWGLLHHAAVHSNVKRVKWILNKGALVDLATEEGETPLMMACKAGATRGAAYLIEYEASVSKCCNRGWTPLHYAASSGALDCCAILLRTGASKDARTLDRTLRPADCALEGGHADTAEVIRLYREPIIPVREVFDAMTEQERDSVTDMASSAMADSIATLETAMEGMFAYAP